MDKQVLRLSVTNDYLIPLGDRYLLVDTGYEHEWELFCKRLKEVHVEVSQISHLFLTHHHDDHCGLLNRLTEQNGEIHVLMSSLSKDLLAQGKNDHTHPGGYINRRINFLLSVKKVFDKRWTLTFPPYIPRETDLLIEGEPQLKALGLNIEGRVLTTPGHTIDSISLLCDDGDCFVGDAAANFLQFAGTKYCVIYIQDLDVYYQSWQKLIAAGAKQIYPAHGRPFSVDKLKEALGKNKCKDMVKFG